MTVGDVNAVIAGVTITGATLWAAVIGMHTLFRERAERAAFAIREQPNRTFGTGFIIGLIAGAVGIALLNAPNGLLKILGWVALLILAALATLGSAGLASLLAEKIAPLDTKMSRLRALGRSAALLVASGFVPLIGWLGFFPLLFLMSVGGGIRAMTEKRLMAAAITERATVADSI